MEDSKHVSSALDAKTHRPNDSTTPASGSVAASMTTPKARAPGTPSLGAATEAGPSRTLRNKSSRQPVTASAPPSRSASPHPSQANSPACAIPPALPGNQKPSMNASDIASININKKDVVDKTASLAPRPNLVQTASSPSVPTTSSVIRTSSTASAPLSQLAGSVGSTPRVPQTSVTIPSPSVADRANSTTASRAGSPLAGPTKTPRPKVSQSVSTTPVSTPASRQASIRGKPDPLQLVAPTVTLQTSTPPASADAHSASNGPAFDDNQLPPPPPSSKSHSRGPSGPKSTLETVIEGTPPTASALTKALEKSVSSDRLSTTPNDRGLASKSTRSPNNEEAFQDRSESEGNLSDRRRRKQEPAPLGSLKARPGSTVTRNAPPPTPRMKQAETPRNMTVETETVSSIPHSALAPDRSVARTDTGGSVRLESSYETIRPKKDRRRPARKAPSVHNGTASSKADIFEARVASVVDEADSDDSDETFVYESNPPDAGHPRTSRHHSRTPSSASITSLNDRRHYGNMGTQHRVSGKRSMKFSNNPYSNNPNTASTINDSNNNNNNNSNSGDSPPDGETGSIRAYQPRHISRFGRTMGSHTSLHGPDSPFTQANKIRVNVGKSGQMMPGTPKGPKTAPLPRGRGPSAQWTTKNDMYGRDFDGGDDSDDENMPLLGTGTVRTPRSSRYTRRTGGRRSLERIYSYQQQQHSSRWLSGRQSGCWIFSFAILLLLLLGASGFSVMSNKSLYDVGVTRIENVLASEQELMLDLFVRAVNPNFVDVQITDMDVNVFAKSSYVNAPAKNDTEHSRRSVKARDSKHGNRRDRPGTPWQDPEGRWGDDDGHDHDGLEGDTQTMLLGRVLQFDQALHFEGSPFRRSEGRSMGEMRLAEPGNRTESGGSARWERVLKHPFQLILRGVLKYQVPVTGRLESAAVYGSIVVHPEDGIDSYGRMRVEDSDEGEDF